MASSGPRPGLVIRYEYLWSRERARGHLKSKDRPACIVATVDSETLPLFVMLIPITHSSPTAGDVSIEIPFQVGKAIGLDHKKSWAIVSEYNVDIWPTPSLAQIPGKPGQSVYGELPPTLLIRIKKALRECIRVGKAQTVDR